MLQIILITLLDMLPIRLTVTKNLSSKLYFQTGKITTQCFTASK